MFVPRRFLLEVSFLRTSINTAVLFRCVIFCHSSRLLSVPREAVFMNAIIIG